MSKDELIVCATCGEEKPVNKMKSRGKNGKPALCARCYTLIPDVKMRLSKWRKDRYSIPSIKEKIKERARAYYSDPHVRQRAIKRMVEYHSRPDVKERVKERMANYHQRHDVKERISKYRQRQDVKCKAQKKAMEYRAAPESKLIISNQRAFSARSLTDSYVKGLVYHNSNGILKYADIPQELIEIKRQSIALKRIINQKQEQNDQHSTTEV